MKRSMIFCKIAKIHDNKIHEDIQPFKNILL
jgi:hypothetical protein